MTRFPEDFLNSSDLGMPIEQIKKQGQGVSNQLKAVSSESKHEQENSEGRVTGKYEMWKEVLIH